MGAAAMTGLVGSAIGAGSSLVGGVSTTAMQNHANKEIAQMNNAFNEKMFDKQIAYNKEMYQTQLGDQWKFYDDQKANAWKLYEDNKAYQTEMWNKTNEYNDPSAQRARLEAAGLNPYMMMNGGSAGVAGSVSGTQGSVPSAGSPSAQGVQPPTATPYSADYSGIMQELEFLLTQQILSNSKLCLSLHLTNILIINSNLRHRKVFLNRTENTLYSYTFIIILSIIIRLKQFSNSLTCNILTFNTQVVGLSILNITL